MRPVTEFFLFCSICGLLKIKGQLKPDIIIEHPHLDKISVDIFNNGFQQVILDNMSDELPTTQPTAEARVRPPCRINGCKRKGSKKGKNHYRKICVFHRSKIRKQRQNARLHTQEGGKEEI